jgi:hypothetical protein
MKIRDSNPRLLTVLAGGGSLREFEVQERKDKCCPLLEAGSRAR